MALRPQQDPTPLSRSPGALAKEKNVRVGEQHYYLLSIYDIAQTSHM